MITIEWIKIGLIAAAVCAALLTWLGALVNARLDVAYGKDEKRPRFTIFNSVESADFSWYVDNMRKLKAKDIRLNVLITFYQIAEFLAACSFIALFAIFAILWLR